MIYMNKLIDIWKRISNTKALMAIVGAVVMLLITFGVKVDNEQIMTATKLILSLLVIIGVINNTGMDTTDWNK